MQKTDLNVSPYYDDFSEDKNFHRVLFRPAFSVQARELTQMQSILQNQIERLGSHFFKEGAMVIPGQAGFDITYSYVKLQDTFTSNNVEHTVENYRTSLIGKKITGATSKVVAKIVGTSAGDTSDPLTIFVKFESSDTPAATGTSSTDQGTTKFRFDNNEELQIDTAFSYTTGGNSRTFQINDTIARTATSSATGVGSAAYVQKGVYYIRGSFVQTSAQTIILDKYKNTPSYRIGFQVTESLSTPEEDSTLLDNATGSTNFAAKGAHRLSYTLTLTKKSLGTADDADFIELLSVRNGLVQSSVRNTEYSVLEETLARRTFDESGDYVVRGFNLDMREHFDDGLNNGVFTDGDPSKVAITLSPGKAYVKGFEIETIGQTVVPLDKARTTAFTQNYPTTFSAGNFLQVENTKNTPDIDSQTGLSPFKEVQLRRYRIGRTNLTSTLAGGTTSTIAVRDTSQVPVSGGFVVLIDNEFILCSGTGSGTFTIASSGRGHAGTTAVAHSAKSIVYIYKQDEGRMTYPNGANAVYGVARTRAFEHSTGTNLGASFINGAYHPAQSRFQHYLFDVRMLAKITIAPASDKGFDTTKFLTNGARVKGTTSGATGIVYFTPQDKTFDVTGGATNHTTGLSDGTTNSPKHITMTDTGGIELGMGVAGTGIDAGSYVVRIVSQTILEISKDATATNSNLTFSIGNTDGTGEGKKLTNGTTFHIIQSTGTFVTGETITSSITGDLAGGATVDSSVAPTYYTMGDAHSLFTDNGTNEKHYVSNVFPTDVKTLKGTVNVTQVGRTLKGTNTGFTSDLKVGDLIELQDDDGVVHRMEVRTITSNTELTTIETFPQTVTSSTILRVRSKLEEQEELVMISKLPKPAIKTLKPATLNNLGDTTLTVRRQTILDFGASNSANISLADGETFASFNVDDFQFSVQSDSTSTALATYPAGTLLVPEESGTGFTLAFPTSRNSVTLTAPTGVTGLKLKVTFTVAIAVAKEKTKTLQPMNTLKIENATGGIYGTNFQDQDICLGKADIFKVRAIYEGADASTDAVLPKITYGPVLGGAVGPNDLFSPGQRITTTDAGSGAIARVIDGGGPATTNQITISYLTDVQFAVDDELVTTQSSPARQEVKSVVAGDSNILSNFTIDNGMRDTFYDLGRISRKPGISPPDGRLTIVYEYFTHGAGDYFSVDSYPTGTGVTDIDYSEIPLYSAQRVDPDTISPTGEYDLRDAVDFRPRIGDYDFSTYSTANTVSYSGTLKSISPFSFAYRDFTSTTASLTDVPKSDDTFLSSFDYYLPQNGALYLDSEGNFKTVLGGAAENPEKPTPIDDAMHIADFRLPQYTFNPLDIGVLKKKNRRFTMKDIGRIANRVENLEYYTQLNMLEKSTESFQMQDGDGLDRFKNGFIVDNFTGHNVGNALHPDYKNSMDFAQGILRPEYMSRAISMDESVSTDSARSSVGYQKTGDLITLPYTETTFINQPYASRIENVNPFNVIAWIGSLSLNPESDIWKDTNRMPNLIINKEGNYDTFIARNGGSAINTVWNEWETFWSGEDVNITEWRDTSWATARAQVPFRRVMETTVTTTTEKQSRTGVRTEITPRIDYESKGDRVVSTDILPFCRARDVLFTGSVFKPKSKLFAFFDNINVTKYITPDVPYVNYFTATTASSALNNATITVSSTGSFPTSGSITVNGEVISYENKSSTAFLQCGNHAAITSGTTVYKTPAMGDPLITGPTGKISGKFSIPDPNVSGNPAFKVGERVLRLTSDAANGVLSGDTETSGEATYYAKGLLDNIQETIIATRNANVNRVTLNQERTVTSTRSSDRQIGWWDPVAQSILIDEKGGAFVTSVDVYFQSKSETVPVQCQIRTMKNGYPTTTILPFGQATVEPENVTVSDDASAATKFTFPSPVYMQQDIEYCFVIMANTQDYMIWLSHMGDTEVGGTRTISDQPYAGVLFKSQNASTWTASQMEDLKFVVRRASFTTNPGTLTLQNQALSTTTLPAGPITTIPGTKKIIIKHPNHGMYASTTNNVTLSNLSGTAKIWNGSAAVDYDFSTLGTFTKNSLSEVGIDHYVIDLTGVTNAPSGNFGTQAAAPYGTPKVTGGSGGTASENYVMDTGKLVLQTMEVSGTSVTAALRTTSATSASATAGAGSFSGVVGGSETSFNLAAFTDAKTVTPNENIHFEDPKMVASTINESLEMSNDKSLQAVITLATESENLSPVVDTQRMGMLVIQNRINNIQRSQDLYSISTLTFDQTDQTETQLASTDNIFTQAYKASTEPDGDANAAVYITRKVTLANASTALKVLFDAVRYNSASIDIYFATLRADDTAQFDDLTWTKMNPDSTVSDSKSRYDFREYAYEVSGLDGFIAFSIKIVMRGTKSCEVPYIKDFRAIALAL